MKFVFSILVLLVSNAFAHNTELPTELKNSDREIWITVGADAVNSFQKSVGLDSAVEHASQDGITVMKIKESDIGAMSHLMHEDFNRCGGFVAHESEEEAYKELNSGAERLFAEKAVLVDYTIDQNDLVKSAIEQVNEFKMRSTIEKLSSFKNRYYKSSTGVDSSKWILSKWNELAGSRTDAKAFEFKHNRWPQPTVILEIKGKSEDVVIIGGHADSIAGWFGRENAKAPGADDNASGIATITEVARVLLESGYVPEKTLAFMGYAAEEVGLLGSKEVAQDYKAKGKNVIGVLQLDMTNFNGSELDIVMMSDYTNAAQNAFVGNLIDNYLPGVKWGYDKCGYACSDHASWTSAGYPASMPFESKKGDMNRNIHTSRDTISQSNGTADHAAKFAKMALAFMIELDK
ncbi:M20/M25/M40 family metallo-hydrolase [Bacteriovoracaceae bacterium]|nr:M20/M25/M40 family metallo-hydrolase [Bacteriovoracaceae bacterium]